MKAIVLTAPGGVECLQWQEIPAPELPSPHHACIRIHAAGLNPVDYKMRNRGGTRPESLPIVLGCDGAGIVEHVGEAVRHFQPGDEVYWMNGGIGGAEPGNYAEYTVVHEDYLARKPANWPMHEAAALPLAWITAWEALVDRAQLARGQTVLVIGGAGGVGHLAIQLAHELGARVAATVGSAAKAQFARALGAEHTILYNEENIAQSCAAWTDGQGVDIIFDTVGGEGFCQAFAAAKVYGKIVTLLEQACTAEAIKQAKVKNLGIFYELMLTPMMQNLHAARVGQRHMLEAATQLAEAGKLRVHLSQALPLAQAVQAHLLLEQGHTQGKIVLDCI